MLLTKSRVSVAVFALISFLLAFTVLGVAERASADNAAGSISDASFGNTTSGNVVDAWDWNAQGTEMTVTLRLAAARANTVFGVEVFVDPAANDTNASPNPGKPVTTQYLGTYGAFVTEQTVCFIFTTSKQAIKGTNNVGIHLISNDTAKTSLMVSPAPLNTNLLTSGSTCIDLASADSTTTTTPAPTATPTAAPVATPTAKPPTTGDFTPGSGLLMTVLLAGFILIAAGGAYLLQSRHSRV